MQNVFFLFLCEVCMNNQSYILQKVFFFKLCPGGCVYFFIRKTAFARKRRRSYVCDGDSLLCVVFFSVLFLRWHRINFLRCVLFVGTELIFFRCYFCVGIELIFFRCIKKIFYIISK